MAAKEYEKLWQPPPSSAGLPVKRQYIKTIITVLTFVFVSFVAIVPIARSNTKTLASTTNQHYFDDFVGASECNINIQDMYASPSRDEAGFFGANTFCMRRSDLLTALSNGGRIGFDSPYMSRGDKTLQTIYNGFNILLRQDLVHGVLKPLDAAPPKECRCNNQFIRQDCSQHFITDSHEYDDSVCNTRHAILNQLDLTKFRELVPQAPKSQYRPIPIIHSLNPSTSSKSEAESALKKVVEAADESQRNTPMLWIGPPASGHVEIRGRKGNQEIWEFDGYMAGAAEKLDVDVLGMWNLTVQANSWDGVRFGERVAIVQAMMVVNWLSRLESS